MRNKKDESIFPISVAAKMVGVTTKMLRIYEEQGLITPHRVVGKNKDIRRRLYSQLDIDYICSLRELMKEGCSIAILNKLYSFIDTNKANMPASKRDFFIGLSEFIN